MRQADQDFDRWYLRLVALSLVTLGGLSSLRYVWMDVTGGGYVPVPTQLLCWGLTLASLMYLIRPRLGHHLLLAQSVAVLTCRGPYGPVDAAVFWFSFVSLLLLPYLSRRAAALA